MMILNELRKHGRLAARRHPMYEKNKVAKILGYVMAAFWAGYLIIFRYDIRVRFLKYGSQPRTISCNERRCSDLYSGTGFPVACSVTKNTDTGGKTLPPVAG